MLLVRTSHGSVIFCCKGVGMSQISEIQLMTLPHPCVSICALTSTCTLAQPKNSMRCWHSQRRCANSPCWSKLMSKGRWPALSVANLNELHISKTVCLCFACTHASAFLKTLASEICPQQETGANIPVIQKSSRKAPWLSTRPTNPTPTVKL